MKLEYVKQLDIQRLGDTDEGLVSGITKESLPFVFELISKKLYSNPIGSVIREITSNCFDSHVEAGVDSPVVISKTYDTEEGYSIEFKDVGTGISPEKMKEIYMNWFSSTRRESNDMLGAFGIGSKTPLSYADLFYITTIHDGKQYEYVFHKGEKLPTLESLLGYEEPECKECDDMLEEIQIPVPRVPCHIPTEEHNSTTIKVVMDRMDVFKFEQELRTQLAYFDNVYFKGWGITNDYDVYEGEYFKFRSDIPVSTRIHVCMGKVRYEIAETLRNSLSADHRECPIAVRFNIGELPITPSREALIYTPESTKLIKERISLAYNEVLDLFNKQNPVVDTLKHYVDLNSSTPKIVFSREKSHWLYLWGNSRKQYRFQPIDHLPIKKIPNNMFLMWEVIGHIQGQELKLSFEFINNSLIANGNYIIMEKDDRSSMYTNIHISRIMSKRIVIRRNTLNYDDIATALGIKETSKFSNKASSIHINKAKVIKEYLEIMNKLVYDNGVRYKDCRPSDEWIAQYKQSVIESSAEWQRKRNREIFVRDLSYYSSGRNVKVYDLQTRKGILVYGFREDKNKLQEISNIGRSFSPGIVKAFRKSHEKGIQAFQVIVISRQAEKELISPFIKSEHDVEDLVYNNNPNIYYWEDFLQHKVIRRCITARYMKNRLVDMQLPGLELRKRLLYRFREEYEAIGEIVKQHYGNGYSHSLHEHYDDLIPEWKEMADRFVAKHSFKVPLISHMPMYMDETRDSFKEYIGFLKYKKIRLRNTLYLKTKEQLEEEALQKKRELEEEYRTTMFKIYLILLLESFKQTPVTKLLTYKTDTDGESNQEGNFTN